MSEWVTFIVTVPLVSAVLIVEVTVNDQHLISQTQSLSSTLPPLQLLGYNPQTSYEFHHKILGEDQKEATQLKGERQRQREREGGGREGGKERYHYSSTSTTLYKQSKHMQIITREKT